MDKKTLLDPEFAEYIDLVTQLGYISESETPENPVVTKED